jgi:lipoprotein-anchoring transpeptidase ErfK/SrfK
VNKEKANMRTIRTALLIAAATVILTADYARSANVPAPRRVVVSIQHRQLAVIEDETVVRVFHVAVGAPASPSPTGRVTIINRVPHPTYYKPGKVVPPGRSNPLGTRWLGLSLKGYGIHGTNVPSSIGKAASAGCIRLKNSDVEELFELVREGDIVDLIREVDREIVAIFGVLETPAGDPAGETILAMNQQ